MRTLRQDGMAKVAAGVTSIHEILRVASGRTRITGRASWVGARQHSAAPVAAAVSHAG